MKKICVTRDGVKEVDLTTEEISTREKEEIEWEAGKEKREALQKLIKLDNKTPRYIEDIISVLSEEQFNKLPNIHKDNIAEKQKAREIYLSKK